MCETVAELAIVREMVFGEKIVGEILQENKRFLFHFVIVIDVVLRQRSTITRCVQKQIVGYQKIGWSIILKIQYKFI